MKQTALFLALCALAQIASAGDKDVLRDACGTLKPASKKSLCFDALERLSAPHAAASPAAPAAAAPRAEKLKASIRGLQCDAIEFQELDSMSQDELEGAHCSYAAGSKISDDVTNKAMAKYEGNLSIQSALLQKNIGMMERCFKGTTKTGDIFKRKYPDVKIDCTRMPSKSANDGPKPESAS